MGGQEPYEVQQGDMLRVAPGEEQPCALIYAGDHLAGKHLGRKGAGGPGGNRLNMSQQSAVAKKKVNGILSCIRQSTADRMRQVILLLYSTLMRSYQFWAPQHKRCVIL